MKRFLSLFLFVLFYTGLPAFALEIGVVDLNQALNQSEPGIRSKNILERRGRQKQQEFKLEESELRKLAEDLRNNPLLTPKAKSAKEQELIARQQQLREKVRTIEQEMRSEERRLTEAIFKELKTVIRTVSIKEKLDLVLEKNAAQVILYMKEETTDLTQKVIDAYNALKAGSNG
ncbi:MAG: OmpH family outer membrane protein [SAR324 cluster bacterium]|nr:OmpH family outer membrane protein [SAR324 cluster bacterium]MBL7035061.1 OmpH family outer membrane protein [SAR324 cluster bacterium]